MKKPAAALLGLTLAAGGLVAQSAPASARTSDVPYCQLAMTSTTSGGDHIHRAFAAVVPPGASASTWGGKDLLPDNEVRRTSSVGLQTDLDQDLQTRRQYVVLGTGLYFLTYTVKGILSGNVVPGSVKRTPIGGGWGDVRYVESSRVIRNNTLVRQNAYALLGDTILRWKVSGDTSFAQKTTYSGYSAVKAMALISQTPTYDTFLATTRGGALYTIRIPLSGQPIVKVVRRGTWQGFESLVAGACGEQTTVLGIDHDTGAPYLYVFGHANGAATVIRSYGKVNRTYTETLHSHRATDNEDWGQLFGE